MLNIRFAKDYLLHRFKANNRHGIHSPFVYRLIDTVIYNYKPQKAYRDIENATVKPITDRRVINKLPTKVNRLLYRLTAHFKPANIGVAGEDNYITIHYLQSAVPEALFFNIDEIDKNHPADLIFINTKDQSSALKYFEQSLLHVHDDSVVIFSGIYKTKAMKQVWNHVKADERVRVTIDLFYIGLVFFKPGMSREDFRVRY